MQKLRSILKVGTSGALITDEYGSEKGVSLELMFGTAVTLEFDMRGGTVSGETMLPVLPLSEIAAQSYYFALDQNNSNSSDPALLRYSEISCASDSNGYSIFTVPLPFTATEKLKELLKSSNSVECKAEIGGIDAEGRTLFAWQFSLTVHSRVFVGECEENSALDPVYYTAAQVEAAISRELIYEYSADGENLWHSGCQDGDLWFRVRHGYLGIASEAQQIPFGPAGADGAPGVAGAVGASAYAGQIIAYAGSEAPEGFLPCIGSLIDRTTYAELFAVIGTLYGEGDGTATFALPDLRGKVMQGAGEESVGTVKAAGLPNIAGSFKIADNVCTNVVDGRKLAAATGAFTTESTTTNTVVPPSAAVSSGTREEIARFNASNSNAIYGASSTVQPPAVIINYAIKY